MIDTDKVKMAFAATPLCQRNWTAKGGPGEPTKLCAVSALVSFAGVQPELIARMVQAMPYASAWLQRFAAPVLLAEYGIPWEVARSIPTVFDRALDEEQGALNVLKVCEAYNKVWASGAPISDALFVEELQVEHLEPGQLVAAIVEYPTLTKSEPKAALDYYTLPKTQSKKLRVWKLGGVDGPVLIEK